MRNQKPADGEIESSDIAPGEAPAEAPADVQRYVVTHTIVGPAWYRGQTLPHDQFSESQIRRLLRLKAIAPHGTPEALEAQANPFRVVEEDEEE